jgi:hypothetical protein
MSWDCGGEVQGEDARKNGIIGVRVEGGQARSGRNRRSRVLREDTREGLKEA